MNAAAHLTEIRWKAGEEIYERNSWLPGLFIFVFAAVIGAKWIGHFYMCGYRAYRSWREPIARSRRLRRLRERAVPPPANQH